jgi:GNAT superfamily N-acetyltransferase
MTEQLSVDIQPLDPSLLDDYLRFFDGDAFADDPRWASCYCAYPHVEHHLKPWEERTAAENRAEVSRRILAGKMRGYLAYAGGKPVGWCNAGPRRSVTTVPRREGEGAVGAITCFLIAKPHRGKGVARLLLRAACEGFREQGFEVAEGYPRKDASGEGANHHGPLSLFLSEGFEPAGEQDGETVVRKRL